jgi:hypothetical protein
VIPATITRISHATANAIMLAFLFAGRAVDHAARPSLLFDLL